jgi:two-component system, LytTR family, sensor kinase
MQIWRKPLVLAINLLTWLLLLVISVFLLSGIFPYAESFIFSLFHVFVLAIVYYLNIYLVNQFLEKKKYIVYIISFLLIFFIAAGLRISFNFSYLKNNAVLKIPVEENWTYLFSSFSTFMVMTLSFFYGLLMNRAKKEKEYREVINRQQEAKLQFLKAQMSPHFLFNTLNNIYSLTIGKAPKASEMLLLLSDLLRYAVYESQKNRVSLESEVGQIGKLIQLYQMKSEKPLAIAFDKNTHSKKIFIEPMILIPLVENCFKHCNFDTLPEAYVSIRLSAEETKFEFETINTKNDWGKSNDTVGGVGLENIQQRLLILYPNRHTFVIEDESTLFKLKLTIDQAHG